MKKKLLIAILCCGAMATNAENPRYTGTSMSIEDALDAVGVNGRFENRKSIAENNGIKKYKGTDKQNLYMLDLLKEGNLIIDGSCYYTEEELAEKQREAANETSAEAPAGAGSERGSARRAKADAAVGKSGAEIAPVCGQPERNRRQGAEIDGSAVDGHRCAMLCGWCGLPDVCQYEGQPHRRIHHQPQQSRCRRQFGIHQRGRVEQQDAEIHPLHT